MNKIFKVIWSKSKQCYVVVSEIAKNKTGKKKIVVAGIFAALAMVNGGQETFAAWPAGKEEAQSAFWIGRGASASGQNAQAIGVAAKAMYNKAIAIGSDSSATSYVSGSTVVGATAVGGHSNANGPGAVALGYSTNASVGYSTAIGTSTSVSGQYGIGIGWNTSVSADNSTAIGVQSRAAKAGATAMGPSARGYGEGALSLGYQALAGADVYGSSINVNNDPSSDNNSTINSYAKWGDTAIGLRAVATGGNATALGRSARATAANAIAIGGGNGNSATDNTEKTEATGEKATAIGYKAKAVNGNDTAIGAGVTANGGASTMIGYSSTVTGNQAFGGGSGLSVAGGGSVGLGYNSSTTSDKSIAIGHTTKATQANTVAIGASATAAGLNSIALGNSSSVTAPTTGTVGGQDSIAMGTGASANQHSSVTIGAGSTSDGVRNITIGPKASASGVDSIAIGNGGVGGDKNNTGFGGNGNTYTINVNDISTNVYYGVKSVDDGSIAFGNRANAAKGGLAIGTVSIADGGIAVGQSVLSKNGVAIGSAVSATVANAVAMGSKAEASSVGAVAIGGYSATDKTKAQGNNALAIGASAVTNGSETIAIGKSANASNANAVAVGKNAKASIANSVAIGSDSTTDTNATKQSSATINGITYNFAGATSDTGMQVSVGAAGKERQIKNVAPGEVSATSTDAINGSQLFAVASQIKPINYFSVKSSAVGNKNNDGATGNDAVAIGPGAQSSGDNGVSLGNGSQANAESVVSIGYQSNYGAQNNSKSIGIGWAAGFQSNGTENVGIGRDAGRKLTGNNNVSIGKSAGSGDVYTSGSVLMGQSATIINSTDKSAINDVVAIGNGAQGGAASSVAIGKGAKALGFSTIAIGENSNAKVKVGSAPSVAIGRNTTANGDYAVALGGGDNYGNFQGAKAAGVGTTAIGSATVTKDDTNFQTAVGFGATTDATKASAFGHQASAIAKNATALGSAASATAENATALGTGAIAKVKDGVAIGSSSKATVDKGVKGYDPNDGRTNKYGGLTNNILTSTNAAVSVGEGASVTRQITGVAAGTNNTDAVNVAQLKSVNLAFSGNSGNNDVNLANGTLAIKGDTTYITTTANTNGITIAGKTQDISVNANGVASANKGMADAKNVAQSINDAISKNAYTWTVSANGDAGESVAKSNKVDFNGDSSNITVERTGKKITTKLNKDITVDSVKASNKVTVGTAAKQLVLDGTTGAMTAGIGANAIKLDGTAATITAGSGNNAISLNGTNAQATFGSGTNAVSINGKTGAVTGQTFTAGSTTINTTGLTSGTGSSAVSFGTNGISAGNQTITGVATGGSTDSNAANIGDVKRYVSGATLNLTDGANNGTVKLDQQNLKVSGSNGVRTYVNGQTVTVSLDTNTYNATTNGIGIKGDSGFATKKYLKDGDAIFNVTGDGNLVKTSSTTTGVQVSVDSTKVKDLAVDAVTVSKANTIDNPITVTPTAGINSKDYAIGIDTTKLAAKTNLAYTANGATAKTVSLAKGLNFVNGTNTVSSVDSDGKVSFDLNQATKDSINKSATAVGRTITLNADSGTGSSQSLSNGNVSFAVSGATGDYISTTMDGSAVKVSTKRATINSDANTGAASVTGADGLATAKNVASAINNTNTVLGNKITKNTQDIATNKANITANKNQITTNTTNIATNTANIANTIALADDKGTSTTAKSLKNGNVSFNIKGDNKFISTAASGNDVTLTVNEQAIKDAAKAASSFKVKANAHAEEEVKGGDTITFNNGDNIEISQTGKTFTIGTAKNITVDSVTAGNTVINTSGLTNGTTAITGTGITTDKVTVGGISIDKTAGINAGGKVISNVASGTVNNNATDDSNAANIGDVKQAVANLSQNLNITDGTNNGTVDLKNQKLNVAGANGVTATVNNQTITVGLDANTVNATTKGIGLTADTGSTGNKYLKDGDVSFAVTGDGNLVSTSATAAGVKVAVDAAKVKDLAVAAVTVSKDTQADNPITVTPTAGTNSKDYAIGIDTTKLAAKTDLTYRANSAADANAKKVSLSKGLDFVDGGSTVATVDNDGKVSFDLNTTTKNQINTNTTDIAANKGNITKNTSAIATNTAALARHISLGADTGTASSQSLSAADVAFNVKGATGDFVSTNMNGNTVEISTKRATINSNATTGEASVTGNDGLATAQNVADAINKAADAAKAGAAWNITTNSSTTDKTAIKGGDTVDLVNGDNIEITQDGTDKKKITVATKKDITVDSVTANNKVTVGSGANKITLDGTDGSVTGKAFTGTTFTGTSFTGTSFTAGNTVINTNGLTNGTTAITGTGVTTDNVTVGGISIDKTAGINAGNKVISNVASGGTTLTNAANIGDVQNAVANLSQNLNITDGTHDGTVDLKNQKLNVAGANGVTATVNNQMITVGLDANTVNATTKGIGLTADTGSTGNKYLKDGDVSFAVTGDGSLVSTSATTAGVKVAVNSATITAGTDGTITGPTTDGVATAKNVADAINAAKKASKTDITANTGEAANATTGNVTLTSTTAADGHTIYDVKINDKVTLGTGANAVTIDGTTGAITGKTATIGGVTVNGTANTIGGLSNTTWNGTAVSGRAATEDQLKAATGATTLKFTGDVATNTGAVNLKDDTFGIKGDNKYISTDVNGKNVNLTVSEAEVKKSAVAAVTVSTDTTDANNPLTVTPTTSADGTTKDYKVTIDGTKIANKTNLSYKANNGTAKQVSLADGLDFTNGTLTTASIDDKGVVKYDVNTASITAGTDGTITGPTTDGVATAQNVADAINAAKKASKTEITANTGEAANATTGNVTLTSTTAADGHTIYDVKLNDKVTLGTGANAVIIDGTTGAITGKTATIGGVTVNGTANTIGGLSNTTWNGTATTGRAATEDQLKAVADAAGSQTWNITADKAGTTGNQTGTKKNATVGKDETVELVAGDNLTINQNERKFTYSLNKDLAGLTSVSIGTGTTETIKLDGATGKITAKNAAIGGVTIDGDNKHVNGLSNTTWNGTATTGRAATEDQLKAVAEAAKMTTDAVNLKFTGDTNTSPGVVNLKDDTLGIVGDGKYVSTDANGKNLTVKVSEAEVKKSAVAAVTVSTDTTDANNPLTVTPTTSADGTTKDYKVTIDGTKIANKTNLSYKANDGTAKQVSLADGLNFKNGTLTTASIDDNGVVKYDVNTASITAGADGTITGPTTDGVATAQNVADAINAAKKASKTEITANTGEAANATTGNVTLTSTTAADGHTIYDVKLNDKVTLGSGANAVTIDGTAGKATIGSSVINGVNNTFTTGGVSPVTLNGATGTITGKTANIGGVTVNGTADTIGGLSNTTWNGTATTGRAATEDQLKAVADAAGSQTWEITADKKAGTSGAQTGTKENAKVGKDDKVSLIAGENLTVDQAGKNFTYSLNKDLVKMNSVTFEVTGGKTTVIKGDSIVQTDGTKVNTSTAGGNTVADGTKSTETTAAGQVIKDGTKSNKSTVDSNVIDDGTGNVNTSNATSNTITDGTNTTETTSSSVTVKDNAGNSTVITKDNITTGVGANKVTLDGTAGKATIGSSIVDGVNNTFTTGGANAVKLDGAAGTIKTGTVTVTGGTTNDITGLSNTTVTSADFATKGRAATEEQLKAVGEQTWQITADKDATTSGAQTGTKKDAKVGKNDKVQLIAGENMTVHQNERDFTFTLNKDLVKMNSATFEATGGKTTVIKGDSIVQTDGTKVNTSTAGGNTVVDGTKSTATTADGTTVTSANGNTKYAADGVRINTTGKNPVSLTDAGLDNGNNVIKNVASGHVNNDATDNTNAANIADVKKATTTVTANAGEAANATKGNVTLTSTTAADGHTIYDVKLNDKVTFGTGANAVTIDGTAGKATIGSSVIDGVNNTFTTGGANTVKLDGAAGTIKTGTVTVTGGTTNDITGLSNTTVNSADFATKGRAATEEQLKAVGEQTWQITADKDATTSGAQTGTKKDAKVGKDDKVQLIAGENLTVNQNERDFTFTLNKDLVKMNSATFEATGGKTTVIKGDSIVQTDGNKTNTATASGNTVANGTKSTETTAAGQVIKDGTKTNTSTVDENTIVDGTKSNKSTVDGNTITDGTNTTATTSSSVTVKDNTGNSTVITKDNITTGVGANKVTLDGTAGKATIGSSIVDGVNNTFTTGGANAVKLDGAAGTIKTGTVTVTGGTTNDITGLSNTTVTSADFATKGRAATEEQLKAVGEQTWQITADKDATTSGAQTGTKKDAKVGKDDKVQLIAGENMTVNQNERDFTFTLNKDLVKMNSATFLGTGSNTTVITGNSITQTAGTQTNTSTAGGNTVADGTKSTETTAAGQVIKDGAKTNTSTVDENTIVDGTKSNKSTVDGNTITDGTNTTATTSSSVTVKDNTGNSTVITKDNITTGVGANKVTLDGTAGKATIGSSIVDGVNNTFTTGGTNAVKLDGVAGTIKTGTVTVTGGTTNDITGLSNTTVTAADFATKGRAATEEQLKAVGEQTWQITADKDATTSGAQTGTKKNAKVGKDDKVQLIAGENLTVNQNERDFTYSLNKDLVKMNSATFETTGGKTTVIKGDSIVQTDGTKVNTSTAGGNTVVDGSKSTATTADGTTVTSANGNTKYAADGVRINTTGKNPVSLTDAGLDNGNNVIKNVASGHVNNDATDNTNAANIADVKKATTTVTANAGEAANATKGNVTLTSTTAADGHTIYDVKLNDKVTFGTGANAVTIDGTAGKATIGSSVIDGVNNTFTTGGANTVKLDGAAGTIKTGTVTVTGGTTNDITGLSNTTVTSADFATKGRAATEEQLKAVGEQTWQITADKDATTSGAQTGTKKDAKVGKNDKVQLIAGENLTVNQNERDFTYSLNKDLVKMNSATFLGTGTNTTVITGNTITQTAGTQTNTSTASGNTVADGTKSTETTAAGQVIKDGAKSNKSTVDNNVIDDGNGNVNTSNATSNTITDGTNTSTITAGKATIGSSVVDGVNNTFTTGGANAVKLDGAAGTIKTGTVTVTGGTTNDITGLSNTTVTAADFATKGRAATEEQLKAVGEQTWQITADKDAATSGAQTGTKKNAKVGKDDKVQLIAGENLTVNQNERDFTYSLNKNLVKMNSATFEATGGKTTVIKGDSIVQTDGTKVNTATASGNTVADGTKSTETTAAGQVIKDGAKSNKSTVDNNVIDDGNGNVNTSNATSNTITDGTNISTVTAGKAQIGSVGIDGVASKITTGGANAVKLDGVAGTIKTGTVTVTGDTTNDITGLSNTTVTSADFATKGRAATEEQLKAVGEQTWQITADKDATTSGAQTGTKKNAKVGKDDKVQLIAGENLTVNQNERDFTYSLNKDLVKMNSATFEATGGKTTVIKGDSIVQTDGTKVNTSTAGGNTVADGTKSTATTADGTTVTSANGNTKYAADGVRINTTGKNPVSLTDAGLDNGNNVIKNVASGHVNNDATDNTNAANIADVKKATTTVTANAGEAANATKGNVTLTSTTAADGHTIYDVKLNDKVTLGTGANAVTIDGTSGKATIGSSVIDGVNNTFTTGGANAITMNGATGTIKTGTVTVTGGTTNDITGLSNTTVTSADFATKGRAATEEQLKAVGEQTWQITADKDATTSGAQTGTKKDAKVGKNDKVQLIAGENLTVNQNERDFTYSLNKDLVKMNSATFLGTGTNTTVITGNTITQTAGTQTNTSTASGNTVADGTKSTETTAAGQVIKDGAKSNKSTVDNNVIDDGNGNVNTSNATSNTITDGTNTTATTSSSVTVKDNAGNSTVITKDNITTGVGGNKITLDGTAGKATVGASVVDGVNNTFTTGGANAVKLDGAAGTIKTGTVTVTGGTTNDITGLSNTTVTSADFATKGRAATEEQLKAVGEQTWQITADKDATTSGAQTGTKKNAKVGKDDKVQLIAGENMTVNQNERDFTFTLNKDLVKMNSATFLGTGSNKTVITGDSITQTAGTQTNTSTAAGNTVADGTKSTETTAAGQVIKDGNKSNKSTVDSNVIDDGNGNVNTSNATSNTITDGTNTSTITAGKANIGNITVDGVNNKITMGNGAIPVTLDGANGHLDGLTNTTWVPGVTKATTGRAATEDQLQQVSDAVGAGWKVNTGTVAGSSGVSNGAASTKVSSGEEVKLQAGDNLVIDQNGKTVSYSLNKDLTKMNSATFEATGGKTTVIKGDSIVQTDGGKTNTSNAAGNTVVDGNKSTATTAAGTTITDGAKTNTSTADKNVINDGAGNTNVSNATSNTLKNAAGDETKADAKGVTVKDAAGNNATFTKDGITITKTGKDTVSLTSDGLDNGKNKIVNVAAGVANTDAVNVGQLKEYAAKSTTELTANNGETAGSTKGNIVLTKTTAADGHTIYDNKLNDKITLGTDPTKAVTVDGTTGTVTGLTNKTWTPGSIVSGRAATEDQLKEAVADSGWKAAVDKEGSGQSTVVGTSPEKIKAEETVTFKAGNNMMVTQTGKSISYAVNPELTDMKSATFKDAAGNTTVTNGNGITITPGSANPTNPHAGPVSLTKDGLNNGNNQIKGVAPGTDPTDAVNVSQLNASNANTSQAINQIAGEVQHVGAHAAAMAALKPIQYDPLEPTQVMAGVGNYRGETAAALGLAHYTNENTMFNVGVSVGGNHNMVNAGVTHKFGYSPEKKNIPDRYKAGPISSVYVMQDEVSSLKKENAEQKYVIADQAARLTTLEAENEQQRRELAETKKGLDDLKAAVDKLLASKG